MKAKATIRLNFPSTEQLNAAKAALQPEADKPGFGRAQVTLDTDRTLLVVRIEADDTVALRSTLNAYLRWINSMINVVEVVGNSSYCSP
jgi:tRNA threonylcarbamoyladenosine modification (KEOPS) complex  Pcc1 subunit